MNKKHEVPEWCQLPTAPFSVKEDSNSGEFSEISDDRAVAWEDTQNQGEKIHQLDSSIPIEIEARFKKPVSRRKLKPISSPTLTMTIQSKWMQARIHISSVTEMQSQMTNHLTVRVIILNLVK